MTQYNFGTGTLVAKRTDVSGQQSAFLGTLQDINVDFDQALKELMGNLKVAVDVAPAALKISGKAKFARIQATTLDNLFFGSMGTLTAASGIDLATAEPNTTATTTFTVTHGATMLEDYGLFYAASGLALIPDGATNGTGHYTPGVASTGTYTIAAGDENTALLAYYSYTVTTLNQISLANVQMGTGAIFELFLSNPYTVQGTVKKLNLKLNAVRSSKLALAWKNQDYLIPEMDFTAFADSAGNIGTIALSE